MEHVLTCFRSILQYDVTKECASQITPRKKALTPSRVESKQALVTGDRITTHEVGDRFTIWLHSLSARAAAHESGLS